ncbi:MAG: hypothetical protein ACYDC6_04490 [Acidobacteriaceae bacterium]
MLRVFVVCEEWEVNGTLPIRRFSDRTMLFRPTHGKMRQVCGTRLAKDVTLRGQLAAKVREMNFGDQSWISITEKTINTYESVLSRTD